jgi:NAD(P)H-flavin reductase
MTRGHTNVHASLLTPTAVRIAAQYDDGEAARHYTFEPLEPSSVNVLPGQFFELTVPGHGEAPFTYVRLPDAQGRFDALVRNVGALTFALFKLPVGSVLGIRGPLGHGWPMSSLQRKRVLVVGGGCGLAPLAAALDALVDDAGAHTALIYGSRNEAMQVLGAERERWRGRLQVFETYDHPSQPEHTQGLPLARLAPAIAALGGEPDYALVCGPEIMMLGVAAALCARGLSDERIYLSLERRMHCGVGLCGHCYVANSYVCKDGPTYRYDELLSLLEKSKPRATALTEIRHC